MKMTITTRVVYNRDTKDYDIYFIVDGKEEYAGSAPSYNTAESRARELRADFHA